MDGPVNLLELAASRDAGPFNQVFMAGAGHRARLTLTTSIGPWHHHPNTPETFIVLEGLLMLEFRDASAVTLCPGMSLNVPAGVSHRSSSIRAVSVSLETEDQQAVLEE
jgi:mannose-6-phosphate isomerase-like protein (cupin superfamily)